jgi:cytochrome c
MRFRPVAFLTLAAIGAFGLCAVATQPAEGDAAADALAAALKRGEALWRKPMASGAKSCAECHGAGPNVMKASRLKAYPRFDKVLNKLVSSQQKIDQMVVEKSKGTALGLGSEDMNALEAYMSTLTK